MKVVIFEDYGWHRFLPLTYMRGVFELLCGMGSLLDRLRLLLGEGRAVGLWCRAGIRPLVAEHTGLPVEDSAAGPTLFLNGRGLWRRIPEGHPAEGPWVGVVRGDEGHACIAADAALAARLSPEVFGDEARCRAVLAGLPRRDVTEDVRLLAYPWDVVHANAGAIGEDWAMRGLEGRLLGRVEAGSYLLAEDQIVLGEGSRVMPCVVIDAEEGPVVIGRNVRVMPHVVIQGPAAIGDGSLLQPGAIVKDGSTIGPVCKVGGEIEASIMQGYSNKQHDGFLGHSYVGSWVNIAADCINSDLKNTYGTVRVPLNGYEIDTGELFVGMVMGDHSKAGINVSFPTGSVIGFCSSIFAPQSPKFVPSFTWITNRSVERYDAVRGLAIARRVMARRKVVMGEAEEAAFLSVAKQALAVERQYQGVLEGE